MVWERKDADLHNVVAPANFLAWKDETDVFERFAAFVTSDDPPPLEPPPPPELLELGAATPAAMPVAAAAHVALAPAPPERPPPPVHAASLEDALGEELDDEVELLSDVDDRVDVGFQYWPADGTSRMGEG